MGLLNRLWSKLKSSQNLGTIVLCLILATMLWFLQGMGKQYEYVLKVKTRFEHLPPDFYQFNRLPSTLDLKVYGYGWDLFRIYTGISNNTLVIDFEQIDFTDNLYTSNLIPVLAAQLPGRVLIRKVTPSLIRFESGKLFKRKLPIQVDVRFKYATGYSGVGKPLIVPDSIAVNMPESLINRITAIETRPFESPVLSSSYSTTLELKKMEHLGIYYPNTPIKLIQAVDRFVDVEKMIPVQIRNVPENRSFRLVPSVVKVRCQVPMKFYKRFQQEPLTVEVNGADMQRGERFLVPVIKQAPIYARNFHVLPSRIDYLQTIR